MTTGGTEVEFGFQAAPASDTRKPDHVLYDEVIEDCSLGAELGYEGVWMLEHHFSDYFPTPSPLLFLAHIARALPDLGLGTSVLVLPWYHPLRLGGEIAMLNSLTRGTLHLGLGRGTAKMEYDAFGVSMTEARGRFAETVEILRKGLTGEPFTYRGKYFDISREIRIRPQPVGKEVRLYGAIGSPSSASIMADLGLPPLCAANFPHHHLGKFLASWRERTGTAHGCFPLSVKLLIADTDAQAEAMARKHFPPFFRIQADHYESDNNPWVEIDEYKDFSRMFANLRSLADPSKIKPFADLNLVGSATTVTRQVEKLASLGFNYFIVSAAFEGVPKEIRREMYVRFARDVAPAFSARFRPLDSGTRPAAAAAR